MLAAFVCVSGIVRATQVVPLSLTETVRQAETIVLGTVVAQKTRWGNESRRWMVTDYTFAVDDAIHTSDITGATAKSITVSYWGGTLDGEGQGVSGTRLPLIGERLLLMLKPGWQKEISFSPVVGLNQGLFTVTSERGGTAAMVHDSRGLPLSRLGDGTVVKGAAGSNLPAAKAAVELDTFLTWLRGNLKAIKAAPSELPAQAERNDPRVMKTFSKTPVSPTPNAAPVIKSAARQPASESLSGKVGQPVAPANNAPAESGSTASMAKSPAASQGPEYYSYTRRANVPIVVNNLSDGLTPWSPEDEYQMAKWNYYGNIFQVYTTPTGTWAWNNNVFDLCGWPTSATMIAQFGAGWDANTIGICYTRWNGSNIIVEGDIALNPAFSFTLDDEWVYNGASAQGFRQVMTHELGHMWGLSHQFDFLSVMNYMPAQFRSYGLPYMDDAQAIRANYSSSAVARTDLGVYLYYGSGSQSVTDATIPTNVVAGSTLTVNNYHVENVGTTAIGTPTIEWYLTSARDFVSTYYGIGSSTYPALATYNYFTPSTVSRSFTVPSNVPPGNYYLAAYIRNDGGASQATFPFSNNYAFSRLTIAVAGAPPADIRVSPLSLSLSKTANPQIFVEVDWMDDGAGHSHKPSQAVIDRIVAAFARDGFDIHIDVSNAIAHQAVLAVTGSPSGSPAIQAIRNANFNHMADSRYYYSIWCHNYSYNGSPSTSSGIADLPGRIHLVSLGSFPGQTGTEDHQVGTFIHEFGHNLNQFHGGTDHENYKPNYVSVMNYHFQLGGIGPTLFALGLANSSSGFNNFGYSHGTLPDLDENHLNETVGIGLMRAVDWNGDADSSDTDIAHDLNGSPWTSASGTRTIITDYDNWGGIVGSIQSGVVMPNLEVPVNPSQICICAPEYHAQKAFLDAQRALRGIDPAMAGIEAAPVPANGFTLYNDGGATLVIHAIVPETTAPWISVSPTLPMTIPAGGSRNLAVAANFALAPAGTTTTRLLIQSNDADENPYPGGLNVTVVNGVALPEIAVEQPAGTPVADGGSKVFGNTIVGSNRTLEFTIKNTGVGNLTGLTITKDGFNASDFTVTVSPTTPVSPGGSTTFTVRFAPTATGYRTAAIHIASNDADENPYDITLKGWGIAAPDIAVQQPAGTNIADGGTKVFVNTTVGTNSSLVFTIRNTGGVNLTGLAITKYGTNAADFTVTANPVAPVIPGGSTSFTVRFGPTGSGTRTAAIHIASNDADENPYDITLKGWGLGVPEIAVEQPVGTAIADGGAKVFANTTVGTNRSLFFTIKNTGGANLTGLAITKNGTNPADFTVTTNPAASVIPGGSTYFIVRFAPTGTGTRTAAIHIANNDANENPYDITLRGWGLAAAPGIADVFDSLLSESTAGERDVVKTTTVTEVADGQKYQALVVAKAPGTARQRRIVEVSPNLLDWYSGGNHTTILQNDAEFLKVRDNTPITPGVKRYIRLNASRE